MSSRSSIIAPSILACDFSRLGEEVKRVDEAGGDWIHCDVMDGHFVNNISFGSVIVEAVSRQTQKPLDVHLMIERPDIYFPRYSEMAHSISIHVESRCEVHATLGAIREAGCLAGLAINPSTSLDEIQPFLGAFDILLVMTVNPGFGGQPFIWTTMEKVRLAAEWRRNGGWEFLIEVDGGINVETANIARENGADIFVAGTSVFTADDVASEILAMRGEP